MPEFNSNYVVTPNVINEPLVPLSDKSKAIAPISLEQQYSSMFNYANENMPDEVKSSKYSVPYLTPLDDTLKYTDPELGYNPTDKRLEYKYADSHPFKTFGNNLAQTGVRFAGAATEAIATIPIAINAAFGDKPFLESMHDNSFTRTITDWMDNLNKSLPTYQTEYEEQHPILKYLNPLHPTAMLGAYGGAINNLGYTAGAIAGALAEDAVITFLTGGAGLFPSLVANASQFRKMLGRAARVSTAASEEAATVANTTLSLARQGENGLQTIRGVGRVEDAATGVVRYTGDGATGQSLNNVAGAIDRTTVNKLRKNIFDNYSFYKFRDAAKYNLALLTSASAEAAFEATENKKQIEERLKSDYFNTYGHSATEADLIKFRAQALEGANITMGINIAALYLSNRLNWGGLFKPTEQVFKETITGFGKTVARTSAKGTFDKATGKTVYEILNKTPETRIGRILLSAEKVGRIGSRSIGEAVEEGVQFATQEASVDYISHKYNPANRKEIADYTTSFLKGVDKTFNTNEGLDNLMGGFVGGILGGAMTNKITKKQSALSQLQKQVDILNLNQFKGSLNDTLEEQVTQSALAQKQKAAVERGDFHEAKNIQDEMLFNWAASGERTNAFEKRIEELDAVRGLEGQSFKSYWELEDTEENRNKVNAYLDSTIEKAKKVQEYVKKVDYLTHNPFDIKTQTEDYRAFEDYKTLLSLNLYKSDQWSARMSNLENKVKSVIPGLNLQEALRMTSVQGLSEILKKLESTSNNLAKLAKEAEGNTELEESFLEKKKAIDNLFSELQPLLTNTTVSKEGETIHSGFIGKPFVDVLQKLFDLHNGIDYTNNKYIDGQKALSDGKTIHVNSKTVSNSDQLADILEQLQDVRKLSAANQAVQKYYTYLRTGVGQRKVTSAIKNKIADLLSKHINEETGLVKTPQEIRDEVEQEVRFDMGMPADIEDFISPEERQDVKKAAKKKHNNEPLTPEEEKLAEEKKVAFEHELKIQKAIDEKIALFNNLVDTSFLVQSDEVKEYRNNTYGNITPNDIFGMYSQDFNDQTMRTNLWKAIFVNGLNNLKATFNIVENPKDKYTRIQDNTNKQPEWSTKLFRKEFDENIVISNNGEVIGILRPINSVFLDEEGKRTIFDITEKEYEDITGNKPETYDNFIKDITKYAENYLAFKEFIKNNPDVNVNQALINKFFDITINPGSRSNNKTNDPKLDVVLKDLETKPQGTALISMVYDNVTKTKSIPVIVNNEDLTDEQIKNLNEFIFNNLDFFRNSFNRYAVIIPINGQYAKVGVVAARNAETNNIEKDDFYNTIVDVLTNTEYSYAEKQALVLELNQKYFIANANRAVKQTFITVNIAPDNSINFRIFNNEANVNKEIKLTSNEILKQKTYAELINLVQTSIKTTEKTDRNFSKLNIVLTEDSLKRQIPDHEEVTKLEQVENSIKLATSNRKVFENFNLVFTPTENIEIIAEDPVIIADKEKEATSAPETTPIVSVDNPALRDVESTEIALKDANKSNNGENHIVVQAIKDKIQSLRDKEGNIPKDKMQEFKALQKALGALNEGLVQKTKSPIRDKENLDNNKLVFTDKQISEAYHKAKADGSNPELVKVVEELLSKPKTTTAVSVDTKVDVKTPINIFNEAPYQLTEDANIDVRDNFNGGTDYTIIDNNGNKLIDTVFNTFKDAAEALVNINKQNNFVNNPVIVNDVEPIYVKNKKQLVEFITKYFKLSKEEAEASVELFAQQAKEWASRNPGKKSTDYFKEIGFNTVLPENKENILNQLVGKIGIKNNKIYLSNLANAIKMDKKGIDSKSIYLATGWEKSADGQWVMEVMDGKLKNNYKDATTVEQLYTNKELYKLYPSLKDINVIFSNIPSGDGMFADNTITLSQEDLNNPVLLREALVHELQHFIQKEEGFQPGANIEDVEEFNRQEFFKGVSESLAKTYRRIAGEVQAFNTGNRLNMSESERKSTPISETEDVSRDNQLLYQVDKNAVLPKETIEVIKKSLLAKFGNNTYIYELLKDYTDVLSNKIDVNNVSDIVSDMVDNGVTLNHIASALQQDELFDTKKQALNYLLNIGNNLQVYRAIELVNTVDIKGFTGVVLKEASNNPQELVGMLKEIAEQYSDPRSRNAVLDGYGSDIIDVAISLANNNNVLRQEAKGAYDTLNKIIYALTNPDVTTFPHELAHAWESQLTNDERQTVLDWVGHNEWTRETSEAWAKGFEVYLAEGNKTENKKLNTILNKFAKWLADIYNELKAALGIELNDKMRSIYANMLNSEHISKEVKDELVITDTVVKTEPLTYNVHDVGEYFVIEDSNGNIDYGQFEDRESAEAFINTNLLNTPSTTSKVIEEKPLTVYHGGTVGNLETTTKVYPIFVSADKKQANEYTKENGGTVAEFSINEAAIATEEQAREIIKNLNLETPSSEYTNDELLLPELIDPVGFEETRLSDGDILLLYNELEKQGYGGIRFTDNNLITLKSDIENMVIFNYDLVKVSTASKETQIQKEIVKPIEVKEEEVTKPKEYVSFIKDGYLVVGHIVDIKKGNKSYIIEGKDGTEYTILKKNLTRISELEYSIADKALTRKDIKVNNKINEEASAKQGGNVFDIIHVSTGKLLGQILELSETDTINENINDYSIDGDERNGFNILKNNRFLKVDNKYVTFYDDNVVISGEIIKEENKKYIIKAINDVSQVEYTVDKNKVTFVSKPLMFDTLDEAKLYINEITASKKTEEVQWYDAKTYEEIGTSRIDAIDGFIKNYNKINKLKEDTTEPLNKVEPEVFNHVHVKYSNGVRVKYKDGKTYTITGNQYIESSASSGDVFYTTEEGKLIRENGIIQRDYKEGQEQSTLKQRYKQRVKVIDRVVTKLSSIFGGIDFEYVEADFNAPARFYKGVVQINLKHVSENDVEIVVHEFLHPFIKALKISNAKLYNNLIKDLVNNYGGVLNEAKEYYNEEAYTQTDLTEEALTLHLGREISKSFTEQGVFKETSDIYQEDVDVVENGAGKFDVLYKDTKIGEVSKNTPAYVQMVVDKYNASTNTLYKKSKSLYARFKSWLTNILKLITDKRPTVSVDEFVKRANKKQNAFVFSVGQTENYGVEFTRQGERWAVKIDSSLIKDSFDAYHLNTYLNREDELTEDEKANFESIVDTYFFGDKKNVAIREGLNVKDITSDMTLSDISDLITLQLSNNYGKFNFVYTGAEQEAFEEMEAFINLNKDEAAKIRQRVVKKLNQLRDTADRRLDNETLRVQYRALKHMDLDENDVDFVLKYIEQGTTAINLAARIYGVLQEELYSPEKLTQNAINRLNKELAIVQQLLAFYDDVSTLYNKYDDMFEPKQLNMFRAATMRTDVIRNSMNRVAVDLTVAWLLPYAEKHNEYLKKEGYTDTRYHITREQLRNNLLYGTDKDTNFITYNLGSNVTSRDPVNAIFANIIADGMSYNNINIKNSTDDISISYNDFLKEKGFSSLNQKEKEAYFKKHYLRKAKYYGITHYDDALGTPVYGFIEKYALHQEFFFDKFYEDLRLLKEQYANPRNSQEAHKFQEIINKFIKDNKEGKVEKYRNHEYTALKNDQFFKTISDKYEKANKKYGEAKLQYGIIPQVYDRSFIGDIKESWKKAINADEKLQTVKEMIQDKFAGYSANDDFANFDDTTFRSITSNYTKIKKEEHISLDLSTIMIDFISEAENYSFLKQTQLNAETLKQVLEGNATFKIQARPIGKTDVSAKIRDPRMLKKAKQKLKELEALKDSGKAYDEELYKKLKEKVDKGIETRSVWDRFAGIRSKGQTDRLNDMLLQFINDTYYGDSVEQVHVGSVSLNKMAHVLSLYTSINSMALNPIAGVSNINVGNMQMLIEAHGGKYFTKKDLAWAWGDYTKNVTNYIADLEQPIKSKDTQLSILLDAIQGEIQDEFGTRVTGNIAQKMFKINSLFLFTSLGEHQIQITGMKAMLHSKKVTTTSGETITLYDAFVADKDGRISLRKDLKDFSSEDLQRFIRQLHGVNRSLNGNYSNLHKSTLQRRWYGTLALKFRKYIYPSFRARWANKHMDYEKNTLEYGYLNFFMTDYLWGNVKNIFVNKKGLLKWDNFTNDEKYALRKAIFEIGIYIGITALAYGLFGGDEDDKKELSDAEKFGLLMMMRLHSDLGTYHAETGSELVRQLKNPTASLNTVVNFVKVGQQLISNPTEVYDKKTGSHEKGDSKLSAAAKKLIPIVSKYPIDLDNYLGYYSLINKNIEGIKVKREIQ